MLPGLYGRFATCSVSVLYDQTGHSSTHNYMQYDPNPAYMPNFILKAVNGIYPAMRGHGNATAQGLTSSITWIRTTAPYTLSFIVMNTINNGIYHTIAAQGGENISFGDV